MSMFKVLAKPKQVKKMYIIDVHEGWEQSKVTDDYLA